jgi:hypothetical protein
MKKNLPPPLHQLTQAIKSAWRRFSNRAKLRRAIANECKENERDAIVLKNGCYSHLHSMPLHQRVSTTQSVESSRASDRQIHVAIDELQFLRIRVVSEGQGIHTAIVRQRMLSEQYIEMLRDDERSSFSQWLDFIDDNDLNTIPTACKGCRNYYGKAHGNDRLVCAMHPSGVEGESCEDLEEMG